MAGKRSKADAADDEFGELFEGIGDESAVKKAPKPKSAASAAKSKADAVEQDILAELENQLVDEKPSRPHTPRVRETAPKGSPAKRTSTNTPPPGEDKSSGLARKSAESTRSYHASFTPSATSSELQEPEKKVTTVSAPTTTASSAGGGGGGGGGWWGGILSTATAAMKQAEAAVKEIQQNEEAKKWAEQVRGNVGALKGLGRSYLANPSLGPCQPASLLRCASGKWPLRRLLRL